MNEICTALADALRQAAERWPEKFNLSGTVMCLPGGSLTLLDTLGESKVFSLDDMDAVAAALGYEFDTRRAGIKAHEWLVYKSDTEYFADEGVLYSENVYSSKREASLAALLAIITHALEDK